MILKKLFKPFIMILMALLFVNLVWTVSYVDTAPLYLLSNLVTAITTDINSTVVTPAIDKWAIRGQIGDIMSGHFSALAFLAVALSIIYQSEANQQMRKSIDKQEEALVQQGAALTVQSDSLKAQIEELQESRKESSKQTEEFFIQNMNVKLDRYYKYFDEQVQLIFPKENFDSMSKTITSIIKGEAITYGVEGELETLRGGIEPSLEILEHIYKDIQTVQRVSKKAYEIILDEYILRLHTDSKIMVLYFLSSSGTEYSFFKLFNKNTKKIEDYGIKTRSSVTRMSFH